MSDGRLGQLQAFVKQTDLFLSLLGVPQANCQHPTSSLAATQRPGEQPPKGAGETVGAGAACLGAPILSTTSPHFSNWIWVTGRRREAWPLSHTLSTSTGAVTAKSQQLESAQSTEKQGRAGHALAATQVLEERNTEALCWRRDAKLPHAKGKQTKHEFV